ncbi:hypothetical protein PISMIDRAFT_677118 [Pisolithus microcarpus 441]|uniref:Uncharacterized protein n=1 Tax=Pisolithus microcarpus 441 TaxID=765257 RepID=A0A0C9YKN5_9AGAM|nr:hypothetical protein PISMIDRAFT_677118 [Pisolithus microcarpus 441]
MRRSGPQLDHGSRKDICFSPSVTESAPPSTVSMAQRLSFEPSADHGHSGVRPRQDGTALFLQPKPCERGVHDTMLLKLSQVE